MQVNSYHLSADERDRRVTNHLCLYCGQAGHLRLSCPSRPRPENPRSVSLNIDALNPNLCVTVPITITVNGQQIATVALLDSGAAGNFMSREFAQQNQIDLIPCLEEESNYSVEQTLSFRMSRQRHTSACSNRHQPGWEVSPE